ncbi:YdeI/OmpD-associated family protein [Agromyces sp. SYSU K20354]|uniref:YdeI/OmpD-associated family protein n=1 Tax=Agromyces cavernae TaxID=2898659 RepID=UPI001E3A3889|nr:YdeI/OmpD-associated family protein [Agromyces cavernae]MCD2440941.1 YdeI/OmpD-associated family protein [Agromyces cavernae]
MVDRDAAERLHVESRSEWRAWLADHHEASPGVWLVVWKSTTGRPRPTYEEQVLEALAVGWVDGQAKSVDDERTMMWFTRRTPKSPWSSSNKQRVARLEAEGLMLPAGLAAIEAAKANGMWNVFDDAERLIEPAELAILLDVDPAARANWNAYPPSVRRSALSWVALAARDETKSQRIAAIVRDAAAGQRPGPR